MAQAQAAVRASFETPFRQEAHKDFSCKVQALATCSRYCHTQQSASDLV